MRLFVLLKELYVAFLKTIKNKMELEYLKCCNLLWVPTLLNTLNHVPRMKILNHKDKKIMYNNKKQKKKKQHNNSHNNLRLHEL